MHTPQLTRAQRWPCRRQGSHQQKKPARRGGACRTRPGREETQSRGPAAHRGGQWPFGGRSVGVVFIEDTKTCANKQGGRRLRLWPLVAWKRPTFCGISHGADSLQRPAPSRRSGQPTERARLDLVFSGHGGRDPNQRPRRRRLGRDRKGHQAWDVRLHLAGNAVWHVQPAEEHTTGTETTPRCGPHPGSPRESASASRTEATERGQHPRGPVSSSSRSPDGERPTLGMGESRPRGRKKKSRCGRCRR